MALKPFTTALQQFAKALKQLVKAKERQGDSLSHSSTCLEVAGSLNLVVGPSRVCAH